MRRYEREHPGELIHIDIKKLGKFKRIGHRISGDRTGPNKSRGVGWEFVHRLYRRRLPDRLSSRVMKDERKASAVAFLKATVTYYASLGVTIERVMTDNGSCYRSKAFARACKKLGLKHLRTKPYRPRPMARPSALSKHRCANGPMPVPTTRQTNAPPNCQNGCTATIGTGLTVG